VKLALKLIRRDGGTQPRAKICYEVVQEYREAMLAGEKFRPVVVFFDGTDYWLADGFHRALAAETGHIKEVDAEVKQGTVDDAIDYACSDIPNSRHGLRETPNDRKQRIETMIRKHPDWSNVQVAEHCGVSHQTVGRVASDLSSGQVDRPDERTGRDGRTINTANIGKTRAPAPVVNEMPLDDEPDPRSAPEPYVEPTEEASTASMEPEAPEPESGAKSDEPPTPPANAIRDLRNYIDVILDEIDSDQGRHYVVNETIKYLREKSIAFNKSA
jgi:hypothetical protein